jgi:hypothetical protein
MSTLDTWPLRPIKNEEEFDWVMQQPSKPIEEHLELKTALR